MSSSQDTASPRAPRAKHQHSKSASQAPPHNNGRQPRRQKGNRAQNGINGQNHTADTAHNKATAIAQVAPFADNSFISSDDAAFPPGQRKGKKYNQSQQPSDRGVPPAMMQVGSLTDSELVPGSPAATPAKNYGAYAGPTFHASPAPSALPIPKFLSKSVPAKTRVAPPTPPHDEGSDSAGSPTPSPPSPSRAPIPVPPRHEDSPLDMLFKADRAEKARNPNASPASSTFPGSPNQQPGNGRIQHYKQNSHTSLNAVFPIELDAGGQSPHRPPPAVPPVVHRSITDPSRPPQGQGSNAPNNDSAAIQDLLNRLNLSQQKPPASAPPQTVDRIPSEPSSRFHTPSPFNDGRSTHRSTSNPTTPAPGTQEPSDFFYGNRNLSPLFKAAAKTDNAKRNSGLRTEITADSPVLTQGGFPSVNGPTNMDPNHMPPNYPNYAFSAPSGPRRGSAPHIQPFQDVAGNRKMRTPGRRQYQPRPNGHPHANNSNGAMNGPPLSMHKANTAMSFIPASVQAKQHKQPSTAKSPDSMSLEQDLKRLLNLNLTGDTTGVR